MDFEATKAIKLLVLPPGSIVLVAVFALLILRRARKMAVFLLVACIGALYALSIPPVAAALSLGLMRFQPIEDVADIPTTVGAIVVLGGGRHEDTREYGGDTVSSPTLERLRYAARLQRATALPLLLSGGTVFGRLPSEAELMREALEVDFDVKVEWIETKSRNTAENARYSAEMLREAGVEEVLLVTHGMHMQRSVDRFIEEGVRVVPAPTISATPVVAVKTIRDVLPQTAAFRNSVAALHEHLGRLWYDWRYGVGSIKDNADE